MKGTFPTDEFLQEIEPTDAPGDVLLPTHLAVVDIEIDSARVCMPAAKVQPRVISWADSGSNDEGRLGHHEVETQYRPVARHGAFSNHAVCGVEPKDGAWRRVHGGRDGQMLP